MECLQGGKEIVLDQPYFPLAVPLYLTIKMLRLMEAGSRWGSEKGEHVTCLLWSCIYQKIRKTNYVLQTISFYYSFFCWITKQPKIFCFYILLCSVVYWVKNSDRIQQKWDVSPALCAGPQLRRYYASMLRIDIMLDIFTHKLVI